MLSRILRETSRVMVFFAIVLVSSHAVRADVVALRDTGCIELLDDQLHLQAATTGQSYTYVAASTPPTGNVAAIYHNATQAGLHLLRGTDLSVVQDTPLLYSASDTFSMLALDDGSVAVCIDTAVGWLSVVNADGVLVRTLTIDGGNGDCGMVQTTRGHVAYCAGRYSGLLASPGYQVVVQNDHSPGRATDVIALQNGNGDYACVGSLDSDLAGGVGVYDGLTGQHILTLPCGPGSTVQSIQAAGDGGVIYLATDQGGNSTLWRWNGMTGGQYALYNTGALLDVADYLLLDNDTVAVVSGTQMYRMDATLQPIGDVLGPYSLPPTLLCPVPDGYGGYIARTGPNGGYGVVYVRGNDNQIVSDAGDSWASDVQAYATGSDTAAIVNTDDAGIYMWHLVDTGIPAMHSVGWSDLPEVFVLDDQRWYWSANQGSASALYLGSADSIPVRQYHISLSGGIVAVYGLRVGADHRYCGDMLTQYLEADMNRDCYVEWADFGVFAAQWQQCTDPAQPDCTAGR